MDRRESKSSNHEKEVRRKAGRPLGAKNRVFLVDPPVSNEKIAEYVKEEYEWWRKVVIRMGKPFPPCLDCLPERVARCAYNSTECDAFKRYIGAGQSAGFGRKILKP